jgi:hypothetical protein
VKKKEARSGEEVSNGGAERVAEEDALNPKSGASLLAELLIKIW